MADTIRHLLSRAGFGMPPGKQSSTQSVVKTFNELVKKSRNLTLLKVAERPQPEFNANQNISDEERKKIFIKSRKEVLKLNASWVQQMGSGDAPLGEKMTLFWHDHFACRSRIAYFAQQQNNTLRQYALENFSDLLMAVSKDPAMLQFLNNQQNKKGSPNENFAREVMELFTLGQGHYAEADIKNAARAFTGWGVNFQTGEFIFRKRLHDDGSKDFRGKRGNFTGEDIIQQLLEDKQTAAFITQKIWAYFVSHEITDLEIIRKLSNDFYNSGYNISTLLKDIYTSSWFYEDRFIGNRVKSPVELLVGIQVHTGGTFQDDISVLMPQRALGQVLFNPPSVGGWPVDKEWIDSSSLTFRMLLPSMMLQGAESSLEAKDSGDVNDLTNEVRRGKISFSVDWQKLANIFLNDKATQTLELIESHLLTRPLDANKRKLLQRYTDSSSNDVDFVKKAFIGYMSLPEYQLS
jgi:uncharacterized protein (DUF1800 family)